MAFWGDGAIERLGLDRHEIKAKILCNLESGACNPAEIRRLRDMPSILLKSHPALHAKVYWTFGAAVVGSSNASANGLAVEGADLRAWLEANVRVKDQVTLDEIEDWFGRVFAAGHEISDPDLERATALWKARAKLRPTGKRLVSNLLAAYQNAPSHPVWRQVKLAFWKDALTADDQTWITERQGAVSLDTSVSAYADWNHLIGGSDWVLDFDMSSGNPEYSLWQALPTPADRRNLRLVREAKHIRFAAFGALIVTKDDSGILASLADAALRDHGDANKRHALIDLPTAMEMLTRSQAAPSERAFERAMRQLAVDAGKIGYNPHKFSKILGDLGGVRTARMLVGGDPMRGTY
ncbi:phospholipase D family protein [Sphingomonas sp. TREG-RG-20F-R18-01]|uniref:phospholipase D family protein n=1 Tax=Sphingomonas sp. TREG-RG-20F-R18-01 TaxID=2914982 RepID=UPI001F5A60F4|nr:phospholipase D family protein [Sphingomonas sp. TREG-RG-20F-R18-01]